MKSMKETNMMVPSAEHPLHGTWLSVDVIALTEDRPARVLLVERQNEPHAGRWSLPGGLLAAWDGEMVEEAAVRILREKAGTASTTDKFVVVDVVSDRKRDDRGHTVSIVVATRVPPFVVDSAPKTTTVLPQDVPLEMPFGHTEMVRKAMEVISQRVLTDPDTTTAMLPTSTHYSEVHGLLVACGESITDNGARSRLERSELFQKTSFHRRTRTPRLGRPLTLYSRV